MADDKFDLIDRIIDAISDEYLAFSLYKSMGIVAKDEGYLFISRVFCEISEQEMIHAKTLEKTISRYGKTKISIKFGPVQNSTKINVESSIEGELEDIKSYQESAKISYGQMTKAKNKEDKDKYNDLYILFRTLVVAEQNHLIKFKTILKLLENPFDSNLFNAGWECVVCGNLVRKLKEDIKCGICENEYGSFEPRNFSFLDV